MKKLRVFCEKHPLELLRAYRDTRAICVDLHVNPCPICIADAFTAGTAWHQCEELKQDHVTHGYPEETSKAASEYARRK